MSDLSIKCPKCDAVMEEGFIMDLVYGNAKTVIQWVEGEPERSIWTGIKTRDRDKFQVATYRCYGCGYLKSYALQEQD